MNGPCYFMWNQDEINTGPARCPTPVIVETAAAVPPVRYCNHKGFYSTKHFENFVVAKLDASADATSCKDNCEADNNCEFWSFVKNLKHGSTDKQSCFLFSGYKKTGMPKVLDLCRCWYRNPQQEHLAYRNGLQSKKDMYAWMCQGPIEPNHNSPCYPTKDNWWVPPKQSPCDGNAKECFHVPGESNADMLEAISGPKTYDESWECSE